MAANKINDYVKDIKAIQDILRKDSLQEYYRSAILGFTVLRRLMQTLEPTQKDVDKAYAPMAASFKDDDDDETRKAKIDIDMLMSESGFGFYNVCGMTFADLLSDEQKLFANLKLMINSFSENVADIFAPSGLNLVTTASAINDKKALYEVISKFSKLDLSAENMKNSDMGTLFGELVQMTYGTVENGENFTPTDFSALLTQLLFAEGCDYLKTGTHQITILDNCCGTSSMLAHCENYVKKEINSNIDVLLYGQDNSGLNIAVCKAEQLMMGQDVTHFIMGDTLTTDCFKDMTFDFAQQNAPYGCGRKKADEDKIKALLGGDLPGSADNQMLFWKAAIRKLKNKGRMTFLSNGSPLFSGSTLSGESKIRKWLLDNDYIEAIIKLTDQGFIDTGITIYAWVLSKGAKKGTKREGWIQLINAENIFHPLKKGIGMKRKEMRQEDIQAIVNLYKDFDGNSELVKKVKKEELYYYEVLVQQPYQRNFSITKERIPNLFLQSTFAKLYDEEDYLTLLDSPATDENLLKIKNYKEGKQLQDRIIKVLGDNVSQETYSDLKLFEKTIKNLFPDVKPGVIKAICTALSEKDKKSKTYRDDKTPSGLMADSELNDSELIPFLTNVNEYFEKEVKPFIPDAWYIFDREKYGCEINFNKYFYIYKEPENSDILLRKIISNRDSEISLLEELLND